MKILSPAPLFSWFSYTTKKWQDFATVILYLRSPRHSYQRQFEYVAVGVISNRGKQVKLKG
ncbi:MAG: hypothetical protein ACK5P2_18745, partial [Pseudanabaena sp.]